MAVEQPDEDVILGVDRVSKRFGGLVAVNDVSFDIPRGKVSALIGPNGAGKTTLFNCITGLFPPTEGHIWFESLDVAGARPHQVARLGVARTFQNIRLFEYMSALDNVRVGQHVRMKAKLWDAMFKLPRERHEEKLVTERARELLRFVGLDRQGENYARNLSYGQQRRLEIARALATGPRLLLLDEPAAGFNPQEKVDLMRLVRRILEQGITILLIEHDMRVVMDISEQITVLDHGEKIAEGSPEEVRHNQRVIDAYLGTAS